MATGDLATLDDVAVELGLADSAAMSAAQQAQAAKLITRVSGLFAQESQRLLAPGQDTVVLRVQFRSMHERDATGFIQLTETPTSVDEVRDVYGVLIHNVNYRVDAQRKQIAWITRSPLNTGIAYFVSVKYTHSDPVPPDVVSVVAGAVARYMKLSAAAMPVGATSLSDALGNRVTFDSWVTKQVTLLPEELAVAHLYRPVQPAIVVGT